MENLPQPFTDETFSLFVPETVRARRKKCVEKWEIEFVSIF
jgi:hypothetical protein